jgi:predicted O-methyltransferase YrrM
VSDWTADRVLGLARNFMEPRVLLTAAELDLFTLLSKDSLTAQEVAARIGGADLRALTVLLDALTAMELLVKKEGKYRAEPGVVPFLSADSSGSVLPMVLHAANLWRTWSGLTAKVRGPHAEGEPHVFTEEGRTRAFIGAMHVVGAPQAAAIVAAVQPGPARHLLDVGGASGTYTIAFLEAAPEMTATLFDRPPVVELARERLSQAGLLGRVTLAPGDFYVDALPSGHDLVFLSAIIHQNSPEQNVALYRKCFDALVPGGRIVIRDHVMSPDRTEPRGGALFAINMLVGTAGGGTYTFDEIRSDLEAAGFVRARLTEPDERMTGLVEAFKP